jgi:hypothetical protein
MQLNYAELRRKQALRVGYLQFEVPAHMRSGPKLILPYISQLIQHGNQSLHDNTVDRKHTKHSKHMNHGQASSKVTKRTVRNF